MADSYQDNRQLEKLKRALVGILVEIDGICRKNDLRYVLAGGTALGAARHGGFIPWDDDLDIAMPREDYDRFVEVAARELPPDLYFRCFRTDPDYYLPFGKVCRRNTAYVTELDSELTEDNEIFIDVFPLDRADSPSSRALKLRATLVKGLKAVIIRKKKMRLQNTSGRVRLIQALFAPFSCPALMRWQERAMRLQSGKPNAAYRTNLGSNYHYVKQTMPESVYFPTREVSFEGRPFMAPGMLEDFLTRLYGADYMKLPPVEKRVTHRIVKLEV